MKHLVTILCLTVVGAFAQAQDLGVVLGYRSDGGETSPSSNVSNKGNVQGGIVGKFLTAPLQIRTGFMYVQRSYDLGGGTVPAGTVNASFVEVPVGLLYKFSDYGGVFAGAAIDMNLAKSCSGGCSGFNSNPIALQIGGSFKIAPQFGFEFYYEQLTSKLEDNVSNPRAVTLSAMATFD